jgi:hypothetical protein
MLRSEMDVLVKERRELPHGPLYHNDGRRLGDPNDSAYLALDPHPVVYAQPKRMPQWRHGCE